MCTAALGHLYAEIGRQEDAEEVLLRAQDLARSLRSPLFEHMCLLFRAQATLARGDEAVGLDLLTQAMALGREHGFFWVVWWQPERMTELCLRALAAGIEVKYVQEFVRRRKLVPRRAPLDLEDWPWTVRIFTLGHFDVWVNGQSLSSAPDWRRKTLYLLKALVALGGRNVQEWQLVDALWPDADGDLAHRSFATTLYRLRKLLGVPEALRLRGGRLSLDDRQVWTDVWALEHVLDMADTSLPSFLARQGSEWQRLIDTMMGLYGGSFLSEDADQPWSFQRREALRNRFLRSVKNSGQILEKCGQAESAVALYRKVLEVDPSAEEIHRRLVAREAQLGCREERRL